MTTPRGTVLLMSLATIAFVAMVLAHARLSASRAGAAIEHQNLLNAKKQLADLHRWRSGAAAQPGITPDTAGLNRTLRTAAADAGTLEKLVSIEPGQQENAAQGSTRLSVFLRLESLSMKELTMFLHRLASVDSSSRAQSIELSPAGNRVQTELWNADVTIAYMNYSPGERHQ